MPNPINEFREESDPRKDVEVNVPNVSFGVTSGGTTGANVAGSALRQAQTEQSIPDETAQGLAPKLGNSSQLTQEDTQSLRANAPFPSVEQQIGFEQNILADIEQLSGFSSVGQAQLKGAVHPTYYESNVTHSDFIKSSLEFNDYLDKTTQKIHDELVGTALQQNNIRVATTSIDPFTFEPITVNLDGTRAVGDRIASFGLGTPQNQERTVWQTIADAASKAMGLEDPTVDITNTPGYYRFADGREFAPLAGVYQLRDSWRRNPAQTVMGFFPVIFNPIGGTGVFFRGSKWGDYPNGALGLALYTWDGISNNWWTAGAVGALDHFRGVDRNVQDGGTLLQAFRGRDHNFSAIKRINNEGIPENPQSLFAGNLPEPKTVRDVAERSWMWGWLKLTPEEFQDQDQHLPRNWVGVAEFGTGLVIDNWVDTATGAVIGGTVGSAIPVVGTGIGAAAGGIAGFIGNLLRKQDEILAFAKQLNKTDEVLEAADQLRKQTALFSQPQAIAELSSEDLVNVPLLQKQLSKLKKTPDGLHYGTESSFWNSDLMQFTDAEIKAKVDLLEVPNVEPRAIPQRTVAEVLPPRPDPDDLISTGSRTQIDEVGDTLPDSAPVEPPRPREIEASEPIQGFEGVPTRDITSSEIKKAQELLDDSQDVQQGIKLVLPDERFQPLSFRVLGDSLDEAIPPEVVWMPRLEGENLLRSPLLELGDNLNNMSDTLLSPRAFSAMPQLLEPGDNLAGEAITTLQLKYNRLGQQTGELQAQLVQEKLFVDDLLEQVPDEINIGRSDILTEVEDVIDVAPTTQLPKIPDANISDGAINLRSVRNDGFPETFYHGTRVRNLSADTIDPVRGAAASEAGIGFHLTTNPLEAQQYAKATRAASVPPIGRQYDNAQGQLIQIKVGDSNLLDGSSKLPNAIKDTLKANIANPVSPQFRSIIGDSELGDSLAVFISEAIENATNYKTLISNLDEAVVRALDINDYTSFSEVVRLQIQRAVALNLRNMGIDGIFYGKGIDKQLTIINPRVLTVVGSQKVRVGNLLEQMVSRVNSDAFAAARFKKSKFAQTNAIDSKLQFFRQKVFTTNQQLSEANSRLARVSDALSQRSLEESRLFLSRELKRNSEIDTIFSNSNQKTIQRNISKTLTQEFKEAPFTPKPLTDPVNKVEPFKLKPLNLPRVRKGAVRTSEIDRRIARLRSQLEVSGRRYNDVKSMQKAQEDRLIALVDARLAMMADELVNLNNTKILGIENFFATQFNLKHRGLVSLVRSSAGNLRANLRNAGLLADGIIDDMVRLHLVKTIRSHNELINNTLKGKITGKALRDLRLDIIELGAIPKLEAHYSLMPAARRVNEARYQDLIKRLEDLGLTGDEIKDVVKSSMAVSTSMDEARIIGNALGLNIGNEELIGYMTRIQSNEARSWMEKLRVQQVFDTEKSINGTDIAIQKSRTHFHYIPEDTHVVAWQLGITPQEVNRLIDNEQFTPLIAQIAKENSNLLDEMIQVGSISKLPYTTNEVAQVIISKYGDELPMLIRNELFLDDPAQATAAYVDYLKASTAQSNIVKRIISDGTEFGWAMPKREYDLLTRDEQKEFIQWTSDVIKRYLPNYNEKNPVYVHRVVHNQFVSMVGFIQDPAVLNSVGQNLNYFNRFVNGVNSVVNEALLLNPSYAPRIFYDGMRTYYSAGGNMTRVIEGHMDMMKIIRNGSAEHLNDIDKVYRSIDGTLVTEREFFRQFVQLEGTDFVPKGVGTRLSTSAEDVMKVFNFKRGVNYAIHFGQQFGVAEGAAKGFGSLRKFQGSLFQANAALGTWTETSFKWALYKSWGDTRKGNRIGQYATQMGAQYKNPTNMRDMQRIIEDYFTSWSDVGVGTKFTNTFRPFAVYAMWNSPAQVRQMFRRPREFINYMKIRSFINRDMALDDQNNEWSYPSFVLDNRGIGLWKDDEGNWVTMVPTNWDSRADFLSGVTRTTKQVSKDQGYFEGITSEQILQLTQDDSDFVLFGDFLKEASPLIKTAVALGTSKDPVTGRSLQDPDTTLGRKTGLNWQTEYLLSAYPIFGNLIRTNPFELFGVPAIVDSKTGQVITPAKPGVLGNERIEYDTSKYKNPWGMINILRRLGFSVQVLDHDKNVNWTFRKLDKAVNQTKAEVRKLDREINKMELIGDDKKFPTEYRLKKQRITDAAAQLPWLIKDHIVIRTYMKFKGITPTKELREIEREALDKIPSRFGQQIYQELLDELAEFEDLITPIREETDTIEGN